MLMYHHMPIHYDTLQHSNVLHKRRCKRQKEGAGGDSIIWLMRAPPDIQPSRGRGWGSTDSVLIVDNYIIVWFNL